jgi:phosphoribosylformylglycinamidine cyclo-ligase
MMKRKTPLTYRSSGVDIDSMQQALAGIGAAARSTFGPEVLAGVGGFGGVFRPGWTKFGDPVLVASADGVGTKLKVAAMTGVYDTVGRDLVAHCVNDILCQGAVPLFFLDYVGVGRLEPAVIEALVAGIAAECREVGCALLGGETAEMPGLYAEGDFDLVGFIVGIAERERMIDGSAIRPGDVLLGLPASGLHTNGYSLARNLFFDTLGLRPGDRPEPLRRSLGEALLEPHRCYLKPIRPLLDSDRIRGLAHITGGGITDNLPRILPDGCRARVARGSWEVPPLFSLIGEKGDVPVEEMYRAFNMGIGMIVVTRPDAAAEVESVLGSGGCSPRRIGAIEAGDGGVVYTEESHR